MMNTAYFDHSGTANGFYNPAEAHQAAYRSFSQSALSLMPSPASVASAAYANSTSNPLRTGQSSVNLGAGGADGGGVGGGGGGGGGGGSGGSSNYVDAACKLYGGQDGSQVAAANQAAAAAAAAAAFKSECSQLTSNGKADQNGFKAPDHQMNASAWQSSLRPSPSSTSMSAPDMRSFDAAAAAACSRSVSDAWSACCNNPNMNPSMGGSNFYPWMAIAGLFTFFCFSNVLYAFEFFFFATSVVDAIADVPSTFFTAFLSIKWLSHYCIIWQN